MKLNNFEKFIKEKFSNTEEEVDIDVLMAAIPTIKSKRRMFPFFLLSGITLCAGLYFFATNSNNSHNSLTDKTSSNTDRLSIIENHSDKNTRMSVAENSITDNTILQNNENELGEEINNKTAIHTKTSMKIQTEFIREDENTGSTQTNFTTSDLQDNSVNESSVSLSLYNNNVNFATEKTYLDSKKSSLVNTSLLHTPSNFNGNRELSLSSSIGIPQNVECPKFGSNPWIWEVGTVMGLSKPTKELRNNNITEINPAFTSRSENEKSLEGLDLEFFISAKRARWPVFLRSGLNYSRWSERMKIDEQFTEIDTVQGIVSTTVSQSGDTITYIYGDIYITKDFDIKKDIHYYINRFDIPLSIAYEKVFGSHAIQAELGARINITTFAQGRIYNNNAEFSELGDNNFFKKITGISYFGKAHYRYYLSQRYFLGASVNYQYLPAEFSKNSSISQKYTNFGLGVYAGMRF